jgi:DNA-binding transcriptional LysR family regulator
LREISVPIPKSWREIFLRGVPGPAETFEISRDSLLPLAFSPEPCVNRQIGMAALKGTRVKWHVVFTSPSQQGIRTAVRTGLGVSVLTREELEPGMKVVDGEYGLPPLPSADFTLIWNAGDKAPAALEFGQMILNMSKPPARLAKLSKSRRKRLQP